MLLSALFSVSIPLLSPLLISAAVGAQGAVAAPGAAALQDSAAVQEAPGALAFEPDPLPGLLAKVEPARLRADVDRLVGFHTRNTFSTIEEEGRGIGAARRWLEAELRAISQATGGRLQVSTQSFRAEVRRRSRSQEAEFVNVLGFLPGTKVDAKGRSYVVSGHYDSIVADPFDPDAFAPGADDDASGTVVILELARVLSAHRFDANLLFVCAAGEEQGLYGSTHLCERLVEQGVEVDGMITNDIVGGIEGGNGIVDDRSLRVFSGGEGLHDPAREFARRVFEAAAKYDTGSQVRLIYRLDRFGRGGDHIPFHEAGFPSLRFTEANEHYARQHKQVAEIGGVQYGDLPEHVDEGYLARVTRTNAAILGELALAPAAPTGVRLRGAMRYDTTVSWEPSASLAEDVAGYVVVWRETTSPVWEGRSELVQGTEVEIEGVVADNHFFGVRAVGRGGWESRTAVPRRP